MVQDAWTGVISPAPTLVNLNRARTAGFITAAYVVVNQLPGATSVGHARFACSAEWDYLNFVAVDVEVQTSLLSITGALKEVRRLGKKSCIYSSKNAWKYALNTTSLKAEWLWNAYYDGDPDYDFFLNPYGGFTKLAGEQYQGTTYLDGMAVDLNNFSAAFISLEEDEMDEATVIALIKAHAPQVIMDALATPDGVAFKGLKREVAEEAQKLLAVHATTPHGGAGLTEERVKQIIRDLVAE